MVRFVITPILINFTEMAAQLHSRRILPEVKAHICIAQKINLPWSQPCIPTLLKIVQAHSDAVGAPEYIFFPLDSYSIIYGCQWKHLWTKPAILWNVVAAKKGEKTAALKRLLNIVRVSLINNNIQIKNTKILYTIHFITYCILCKTARER